MAGLRCGSGLGGSLARYATLHMGWPLKGRSGDFGESYIKSPLEGEEGPVGPRRSEFY